MGGLFSGNKVFKNGDPAFLDGGVVVFLGPDGPGDFLGLPQVQTQPGADRILPVLKLVGHKVRGTHNVGQQMGQCKLKVSGKIILPLHEVLRQLAADDIGTVLTEPLHSCRAERFDTPESRSGSRRNARRFVKSAGKSFLIKVTEIAEVIALKSVHIERKTGSKMHGGVDINQTER